MKKVFSALITIFMILSFVNVASADLNDGLVAYYPFNGNAIDESGNGNEGTVYGAILATDRFGNADSAYSFDGIDDYIEINSSIYGIKTFHFGSSQTSQLLQVIVLVDCLADLFLTQRHTVT